MLEEAEVQLENTADLARGGYMENIVVLLLEQRRHGMLGFLCL